jgi:hypothetical protein
MHKPRLTARMLPHCEERAFCLHVSQKTLLGSATMKGYRLGVLYADDAGGGGGQYSESAS